MHMTRSDLKEAMKAEFKDLPAAFVDAAVMEFFDSIIETLTQDGRAEFRGFGTFGVKERGGHMGRNPRTGAPVYVDKKRAPFFRVSRSLVSRMNKW